MSLQILIGVNDFTSNLIKESFKLTTSNTTQSSFNASFKLFLGDPKIEFGQEVIVNDTTSGTVLIFGGIIKAPKQKPHNDEFKEVSIISNGYENFCTHIDLLQRNYTFANAGLLITDIVTEKLIPEGFTIGQIDDGIALTEYPVAATTIDKVFDDLANASGFRWWIDIDKKFYFTDSPVITASTFNYDTVTQDSNFLVAHGLPDYSEDGADYRNKHILKGNNAENAQIVGFAVNAVEQARMAALFGTTGVYAKVEDNQNIVQAGEAITAAQAKIDQYPVLPAIFDLEVFDNAIQANTTFLVNVPILDVDNQTFLIESITTSYFAFNGGDENKEFLSKINSYRFEEGLESLQRRTWADKLKGNIKLRNDLNSKETDTWTKEVIDRNDGTTLNISTIEIKRRTILNVKSKTNLSIIGNIVGFTPADGANKLNINIYKNDVLLNSTCPYGEHNLASYTDPDTLSVVNVDNIHNFFESLEGEAGGQQINFDIGLSTDEGSFTIPQNCFVVKYSGNGLFAGDSVQVPFIQISIITDLNILDTTFNYTFDNPIDTVVISTDVQTPIPINYNQNLDPNILDTTFIYIFDNPIVSESYSLPIT